ncbi:MAG: outer membrane protein insertion porin family [Chthoniobacter sp.]|jgi:outer membrane protein insertion porin family|nr:outer membrane protein insertion porin family [Chthoniobacter sp.]
MKELFRIRSAARAWFCLLAIICTVMNSFAQPQEAPAPIVKQIDIQYAGPSTVSRERILANMRTKVGRPYSQGTVEEDVRNLYATGNVTNVRIFGQPVTDGVKVIVVVQSKATIGTLEVQGATKVKAGSLKKQFSSKPGEALSEASVEADRQKILDAYASKGFTDTQVTEKTDIEDATGKARVVFMVNEGGKTAISAIHFEGNTAFTEKQLRKVLKTKSKNLLSFLTKAGQLKNEQLDADVQTLREYYQNHGYVDVAIGDVRIDRTGDKDVTLFFPIREGAQYHVGSVAVAGAQVFTPDEVTAQLKTHEGNVFSPADLKADVKAISDLYGARGYIDLQATADTANGGSNVINVVYRLGEGNQSYIERVNISGNTRTKDKVIRRELAVAPGEVYNTTRVDASKQRLQNLNYFSRIESYPSDTLVPGRKDLNVLVEEKRTGSFNFGAGFSTIDSLLGFVEVQQSNFDLLKWPDFTGGGQRFRTRIQYGTKRKDFLISLTEPWFLDYQVSVGGEVFYNEAQFVSSVYDQRNYGFDLNARKALTQDISVRLDYRLEEIDIFHLSSDVSNTIREDAGNHLKSSVTTGVTYDTRDSVFLTRKGQRVDLSGYIAGGPLGGNVDIYGFDLTGSQYFHLPWDTIFLINGEIATVDNFNGGSHVPIFDRLYLGGANNLRGFKYRHAGPKDENDEPIGGNTLARLTLEYTFPIVDRVRGAVFYDTGFVNRGAYQFGIDDLNSDFGIGLRLDLPIGPVRLDYGIPIQSSDGGGHSGKFNFTIGYQF